MITVKEIAQICQVSPSTVSNILNGKSNVSEKTRQKVLQVVKETGYQPNFFAQSMRKRSNRMIGIIVEALNQFSTGPIVAAIMAYCEDHGYRTILMNLRIYDKWKDTWFEDEEKLKEILAPNIQEALSIRMDGLIYVAGHCRRIDCFPDNLPIPGVLAYALSKNDKYPSVTIDDEKGGYEITGYLAHKGHKRIGVIGGTENNIHTQTRLVGYQKAMYDAGLLYNPLWVRFGDWERQSGYEQAKVLLDGGVTAIFCMNDIMAAGAYDCIRERGLVVGKDVSVAGYDNREIADYLYPRLTTSAIPLYEIGRTAAEIIIQQLENDQSRESGSGVFPIPCRMIERDSVGVPEENRSGQET